MLRRGQVWDATALSLHALYSQAPENEATQAWDTKGVTKDKSPCRALCWGSWPMHTTALLSIWAGRKVLYEHSWLNKLKESAPSNSAVAMRMEKKLNTKASRKKTENWDGKNRELNYQSKDLFPCRSNKSPPNTEYYSSNSIWQGTCKFCWNDTKYHPCKLLCHFHLFPNLCSAAFGQLFWPWATVLTARYRGRYRCSHSFQVILPWFLSNSSHLTNPSIQIKRLTAEL